MDAIDRETAYKDEVLVEISTTTRIEPSWRMF
jgi:hypothetical protein